MRLLVFVMILVKHEQDTYVNSSGMNAMFDITYNFRLSVKFSTHMMNSTREKNRVQLCCTMTVPTTSGQMLC